MRGIARFVTFLFHPFLSPFYGLLLIQKYTGAQTSFWPSRFYLPLILLTFILPIIVQLNIRGVFLRHQIKLPPNTSTTLPIIVFAGAIIFILTGPIPIHNSPVLYYYFIGLLLACFTYLILLVTGNAFDFYLIGIGSLLGLLTGINVIFGINLTALIALLVFTTGVLSSLRLIIKQQGYNTLLAGLIVGMLSEFILIKFWA